MPSTFDRFAPFVQEFIYSHDWESLRSIQVAAADAIFSTDSNVLLTSSTASGKTEAAFFPILTLLSEDPPNSVGALYIGPLKALINDQFLRLNDLCEQGDINVWHWHGDVSASHKNRLLKKPSGVLQITPESLEALLMHRHAHVARLFCDLRFVVIDEVHSLLRGDRGLQTLCLIERMSRIAGCKPRRIGLSATIGDPQATARFLAYGSGRDTVIPRVEEPGRTWRISMEHFFNLGPQASGQAGPDGNDRLGRGQVVHVEALVEDIEWDDPPAPGSQLARSDAPALARSGGLSQRARSIQMPADEPATDRAPVNADPGVGYIFEHTRGRKCLVFSNSREECEAVTATLRTYCERNGEPDRFLIHHGNLSSSFRESAEQMMRDDDAMLTTCTTATLELGIDIGRLERAFQIDAPYTVSSFLQRMGRTGRRSQPPEMWFVMREDPAEPRALLPETIPWKLLQGIALVQLYLEERWVEPPRLDRLPFSLLFHQTLAVLASQGEMPPNVLAARILTLAPFARVGQDDFRTLLLHMLDCDYIEKTETGGLIVGLAGERITNNFRFYGVFVESEEYTVRCESQELGTIVAPPPPGDKIAIAGHVWIVEEVDHKRRLVYCTQVKGVVPAYFGECPGDINTRILERMRTVLLEQKDYPYLRQNARARLMDARCAARQAGIGQTDMPTLINLGQNTWVLFPWLGTYAFLALERVIKLKLAKSLGIKGVDSSRPYYIQFIMDATEQEFLDGLQEVLSADLDPLTLVYPNEVPVFDKYDEFLPAELVRRGFAYGVLDVQGVRERFGGSAVDDQSGQACDANLPA